EDLERLLSLSRDDDVGRLIVLDGVFSMLGDIAPLEEITSLAEEYNARVLVDEAHAVGVLGAHGRGATEHCGVEDQVDLVLGTFSKSLASIGGFLAGPEEVIHYIKHFSRPLIFSASIPPASVATVIAALEVLEAEPERRKTLWENTERVRRGLTDLGFNLGPSQTPIIPVIIGDQELTFRFWRMLTEEGIFANPVTSPAVPPGMDLIRTSYMATHTPAQIDRVVETFEKVGKKLRLVA
ncbi:MAG TPA: aminotransferase class I/II-fold pyridoxal phosphate-dependent enzyme, partial [Planctomycetes bacterium]|nr:aminotransferase class I/II-fold pyridoxal phosphate-dependent enzyme [Planctomycetota bacterium]